LQVKQHLFFQKCKASFGKNLWETNKLLFNKVASPIIAQFKEANPELTNISEKLSGAMAVIRSETKDWGKNIYNWFVYGETTTPIKHVAPVVKPSVDTVAPNQNFGINQELADKLQGSKPATEIVKERIVNADKSEALRNIRKELASDPTEGGTLSDHRNPIKNGIEQLKADHHKIIHLMHAPDVAQNVFPELTDELYTSLPSEVRDHISRATTSYGKYLELAKDFGTDTTNNSRVIAVEKMLSAGKELSHSLLNDVGTPEAKQAAVKILEDNFNLIDQDSFKHMFMGAVHEYDQMKAMDILHGFNSMTDSTAYQQTLRDLTYVKATGIGCKPNIKEAIKVALRINNPDDFAKQLMEKHSDIVDSLKDEAMKYHERKNITLDMLPREPITKEEFISMVQRDISRIQPPAL